MFVFVNSMILRCKKIFSSEIRFTYRSNYDLQYRFYEIFSKMVSHVLFFKDCKDIVILHIGYLSYPNYEITVGIFGLEGMKYKVKDIDFTVSFMNDSL